MTAPGTREREVIGAVALLREALSDLGGCEVRVAIERRASVQATGVQRGVTAVAVRTSGPPWRPGPVRLHLTIELAVDDPDEVIP